MPLPSYALPQGRTDFAACEAAIAAAERAQHLPYGLLGAIARVESGRPDGPRTALRPWPWTINAAGTDYVFDSKQAAIDGVQALQARGIRSIDVGCLQVNLLFHPLAFTSLDDAFDPMSNAFFAAAFLRSLYADIGDWPAAAAAYHSRTPELASQYRKRVMAGWRPDHTLFDKWYLAAKGDIFAANAQDRSPATEIPTPAPPEAAREKPALPNISPQTNRLLTLTADCSTVAEPANAHCPGRGAQSPFASVSTLRRALHTD